MLDRGFKPALALAVVIAVVLLLILGWSGFATKRRERSVAEPEANRESLTHGGASDAAVSDTSDASRGGTAFTVLDLANARPVAGLRVRVRIGSRDEFAESDADGRIEIAAAGSASIAVADAEWFTLPRQHNDPVSTGTLWVFREIGVEGVVRATSAEDKFDPRKTRIQVLIRDDPGLGGVPSAEARSSVVRSLFPDPPSKEGRFGIRVPCILGVTIAASARGWKPAWQTINTLTVGRSTNVELWLDRAFVIRGVLRSSDGDPLGKVTICVYSLMPVSRTEMTEENLRLLQPRGGFTGSIDLVTGKARAKFMSFGGTKKDGSFEVPVPVVGETVVVAYARGHRPVEIDLGTLRGDREGLDLVAERVHETSFLRIVVGAKSFPQTRVFVVDMSLKDGDVQPGHYFMTDAESRIVANWLIPGRRYYFQVSKISGHLVWTGQRTIDVQRDLKSVSELPRR